VQKNSEKNEEDLEKIYTNVKSVPNFTAKIADFLRHNVNHSLHRRIVRKTFPRRRIITQYPFQIFQADLVEYRKYRLYNKGFSFILVIIDCFSKMVYAVPIKLKNSDYMSDGIDKIFSKLPRIPNSIITDQGLEFYNSKVQQVFENYGVNHYSTPTITKWKASMVERVNRTLKTRLEKYFDYTKSKNWIDFLPQLISNYNSTPHRTIGIPPDQVTDKNSLAIYKRVFGDTNLKAVPRLSVGDKVRILKDKEIFEKGYTISWSEIIYKIKAVIQKAGIVWYELEDLNSKQIPGIKYYWELNLVTKNVDKATRPSY